MERNLLRQDVEVPMASRHGPSEPIETRNDTGTTIPRGGQGGFTLVELLIVLALIGVIATIMVFTTSSTLKKQRVEAQAAEVKGFVERAYIDTMRLHVPIYIVIEDRDANGERLINRWADDGGVVPRVSDGLLDENNDTLLDSLIIPRDIALIDGIGSDVNLVGGTWFLPASIGKPALLCNIQGYLVDPDNPGFGRFNAILTIPVTHTEMVEEALRPRFSYDVDVTPLWHVTTEKRLW
jgi:prepilin-type N-terminal cleavage/methylation domain-containing protein